MTEPAQKDKDRLWNLRWNTQLGIRYHMHLQNFYSRMRRFVTVLSLISSSAAFAFIFQNNTEAAKWLACVVALSQILDLVFDSSGKALLHASLRQRYLALEVELTGINHIGLEQEKNFKQKQVNIEIEEPPIIDALLDKCHNELAKVHGFNDHHEEVSKVSRLKAWWYS
ncbi:hypothetical protein BA894_10360 [Vibrio natriegens]|uniref:hypothetical protein n=1 Tax=Vibrio natriegens TaxID=691 RepID=UPI000803CF4A|nr:hypothetical protein [Vibrio natriegens]ANQ26831.1 hypothetical protein BA894_10360 [Vibrio natriegens]